MSLVPLLHYAAPVCCSCLHHQCLYAAPVPVCPWRLYYGIWSRYVFGACMRRLSGACMLCAVPPPTPGPAHDAAGAPSAVELLIRHTLEVPPTPGPAHDAAGDPSAVELLIRHTLGPCKRFFSFSSSVSLEAPPTPGPAHDAAGAAAYSHDTGAGDGAGGCAGGRRRRPAM
jgi:hypothetical protein